MKNLTHCINCGADWNNTHYTNGDDMTLAAYWCPICEHKIGILAEDLSTK